MKTRKAVLVDDETDCTDVLSWMLKEHCPSIEVIAVFNKPDEAMKNIPELKPELLFLDIEMPRINGFQLIEKLMPVSYPVIFTTAYDKFAVKAFRYSAMDYLMKPIDKTDLINAVNKFENKLPDSGLNHSLEFLLQNLKLSQTQIPKLAIPTQDGLIFIEISDIVSCESDSNYTTFYLLSGEKIIASKTMKEFQDILEENHFFRVHHSHIISLNLISKYVRGDGGYVIMKTGASIPVSRTRKDEFLERLSGH